MAQQRTTRILVVTAHAHPSGALLDAITRRAETGDVQFRVVVPNPAGLSCTCSTPSAMTRPGRQGWYCARRCRSSSGPQADP